MLFVWGCMIVSDLIRLIVDNGIAVVVTAYFIIKDYKFNNQLVSTLQSIKDYMREREDKGGKK